MKQKLSLTVIAILLLVGVLGGSLMTLSPLQEAEAGQVHMYNCTFVEGKLKHCEEIVYHPTH